MFETILNELYRGLKFILKTCFIFFMINCLLYGLQINENKFIRDKKDKDFGVMSLTKQYDIIQVLRPFELIKFYIRDNIR